MIDDEHVPMIDDEYVHTEHVFAVGAEQCPKCKGPLKNIGPSGGFSGERALWGFCDSCRSHVWFARPTPPLPPSSSIRMEYEIIPHVRGWRLKMGIAEGRGTALQYRIGPIESYAEAEKRLGVARAALCKLYTANGFVLLEDA